MIKITENLALKIWDNLNETALNIKSGAFRRSVVANRNRLEKAMKNSNCCVPKSENGRADDGTRNGVKKFVKEVKNAK